MFLSSIRETKNILGKGQLVVEEYTKVRFLAVLVGVMLAVPGWIVEVVWHCRVGWNDKKS